MDKADLENRFRFHPSDAAKGALHAQVRASCGSMAAELNRILPEGREKALAITHLEEVMMWANASLAREG